MINKKLGRRGKRLLLLITSIVLLVGCGEASENRDDRTDREVMESSLEGGMVEGNVEENSVEDDVSSNLELKVRFGDEGDSFTMYLYENNETAETIAGYVGSSGWRLPIYEYDDEVNYDVMQYYDISNSYEIPSNPQSVTNAKAGEVYYSDPNRIILFYGDAEVSQEYTPIGYFDPTQEFLNAVRDNPTLEGWGNKIIQIEQP